MKANFDSLKKSQLEGDELRYYKLIENGKRSARQNIRFEGKYLGGEIVDIIRKVAEQKDMSVKEYLKANEDAVNNLIESGYTMQERRIDSTIDSIAAIKRKTVEVDNGETVERMTRAEAIERLAKLEQFAASNSTIVSIAINFKLYKTGKIRVTLPTPESYEDMTAEEFEDMLDELGIFYIKSPKKK